MIQIYGTLGPACANEMVLKEMFALGMTGMRLNLSHVTLKESAQWISFFHRAAAAATDGIRPQLLMDLQGPELRTGRLDTPIELKKGTIVSLSSQDRTGEEASLGGVDRTGGTGEEASLGKPDRTGECASLGKPDRTGKWASPGKPDRTGEGVSLGKPDKTGEGVSPGSRIVPGELLRIPVPAFVCSFCLPGQELLLDDGKLLLRVEESVPGGLAKARVIRGGTLNSRKSIAFPGIPEIHNAAPTLTEADLQNIRDARTYGVTAVMQPFVRSREDLETVREALNEAGGEEIRLLAKIENLDGVRQLETLFPATDEIVIARGDLGNAIPLWELPGLQRDLAQKCRQANKPFMVVTQMLASMEKNPVPTRAEVNDIFHAVLDGAASVMVTGETAAGAYPAEVIRYLANTVKCAQEYQQKD
jgi:pyruvate kinase